MESERTRNVESPGDEGEARHGSHAPAPAEDSESPAPYRPRFAPLWNNAVTMVGLFLAALGVILLLTFGLFSLVTPAKNPYVDIFGFLILPSILVIGLILMPLGILFKSWRLRRLDPRQRLSFRFPRIDLNDPLQRRAAKILVGGTFIFLPVVGVSAYHGYHYTDSAEFCSQACHSVMEPQATTYALSGHARVACAECHIGSGASWFVKSKLSGTRQVIAVMRDSYSKPIPPAIRHLRPARDTCEECHWPEKFFGNQLADLTRFASDEHNTRHEVQMVLKTGGGSRTGPLIGGIHFHIALSGRIEYLATDDRLQEIPWVKLTDYEGTEVIYRSDGRPHTDPPPEGQLRHMDCMDCHNRPAHRFLSPAEAVDVALREGNLDNSLPYLKREAVAALVRPYPDAESAQAGIAQTLAQFYRDNYPDLWNTRRSSIKPAIETIQEIYRTSFFPRMKVDWRTYPENIGHKISPGCFRCHDGRHVDKNGNAISHACSTCHTFLNPQPHEGDAVVIHEGEFIHPWKLEGAHAQLSCHQCHTGGTAPASDCAGCHTTIAQFRAGTLAAFRTYSLPPEPMADDLSCADCHDLTQPTTIEAIDRRCLDCHDEEYEGMLAGWKRQADQLLSAAEAAADAEGKTILDQLRQTGPLHNLEATRIITQALTGSEE